MHLIIDNVRDSLNFSLMHPARAIQQEISPPDDHKKDLLIDSEHNDYLSYLEQLFLRSQIAENVTNPEWQRTLMLAAAELANLARLHSSHFSSFNEIHRVLLSLISLHPSLFMQQLEGLEYLTHANEEDMIDGKAVKKDNAKTIDKVLLDMNAILGVPFRWSDWDHTIGFVMTEESEAQSELARLVADEQRNSMAKMEHLLHTLNKTENDSVTRMDLNLSKLRLNCLSIR